MKHPNLSPSPKLSIVVQADEIEGCLNSLTVQTFPDFEVIVVDNGSTDTTTAIARDYGARVIFERRRGVSRARQAGFLAARGEIIVSTDADTLVPPNWLYRIYWAFMKDPDLIGVSGPLRLKPNSSPDPRINDLLPYLENVLIAYHRGSAATGAVQFWGANFAVRREAFLQVRGFRLLKDGHYYRRSEDIQLGLKLRQIGKVRFLKDLAVYTSARKLHGDFWKIPISNLPDYFSIFLLNHEV